MNKDIKSDNMLRKIMQVENRNASKKWRVVNALKDVKKMRFNYFSDSITCYMGLSSPYGEYLQVLRQKEKSK